MGVAWRRVQRDIQAFTALFMMLFISAVGLCGSVSARLLPLYVKPVVDLGRHVLLITPGRPRTLPELLPVPH